MIREFRIKAGPFRFFSPILDPQRTEKVMEQIENEEVILDRKEASHFLRISPATLDRLVKNRKIEHFRIGRRVFFSRAGLLALLSRCRINAGSITGRDR